VAVLVGFKKGGSVKSTSKVHLLAAAAVVVLVAAACGSSSKNSSSSSTTSPASGTTAAQAAATGTPINIGVIASLTGGANVLPEAPIGAEAAAAAINKSGGIGGHPIHLVMCDDQDNPNAATECANKIVSAHAAAAVVNGSEGNSYEPVLLAAHIPEITAYPNSSDEQTFSNVYPVDAGSIAAVAGSGAMCAKLGATKIGAPIVDLSAAYALIPGIYSAIEPFGLTQSDVKIIKVPPTATDLSSYVAAATNGTKCVAQILSPNQQALFAQQMMSLGITSPDVSSGGALAPARIQNLKSATNLYQTFLLPDPTFTTAPGIPQFLSEVQAYGAHGQPVDSTMLGTWASMHLAAKYINPSNPTGTELMQTLNTAGTINMPPLPPLNFANNVSFIKGLRSFTNGLIYSHWVNGKFVPYYGGQYQNVLDLKSAPPLNG
jgi:branched-chain amino acid transport system substrate-binding protein